MISFDQLFVRRWMDKGYVEYEQIVTQQTFERAFEQDVKDIVTQLLIEQGLMTGE